MMVSGIPCLGTVAANHERELFSSRGRLRVWTSSRGRGRCKAYTGMTEYVHRTDGLAKMDQMVQLTLMSQIADLTSFIGRWNNLLRGLLMSVATRRCDRNGTTLLALAPVIFNSAEIARWVSPQDQIHGSYLQ